MMDRHLWKYYLLTISLASGNNYQLSWVVTPIAARLVICPDITATFRQKITNDNDGNPAWQRLPSSRIKRRFYDDNEMKITRWIPQKGSNESKCRIDPPFQWRIQGRSVHLLVQFFFDFMQFSAKILQNNRFEHPIQELAPFYPPPPPPGNPGSATTFDFT